MSVCEGKRDVNCWASHVKSVDGRASRLKRAACASGREKSRHLRQDAVFGCVDGAAAGRTLGVWSCAALGLEFVGMGGGAFAFGSTAIENGLCDFCGIEGVVPVDWFIPHAKADLRGLAGTTGSCCCCMIGSGSCCSTTVCVPRRGSIGGG